MTETQVPLAPPPQDGRDTKSDPDLRFLQRIVGLDRASRAQLKRAAGFPLTDARGCRWFHQILTDRQYNQAELYFLVAVLLCQMRFPERGLPSRNQDPEQKPALRSFGRAIRRLADASGGIAAGADEPGGVTPITRRFGLLLDASLPHGDSPDIARSELGFRLRQIVRLAAQKDVALPWDALLKGLLNWNHPRRWVQKQWAQEYFRSGGDAGESPGDPSTDTTAGSAGESPAAPQQR